MNYASAALLAPIAAFSLAATIGAQSCYSWPGGHGIPGLDQPYALAITDWDVDGPGPAPAVIVIGGFFQLAGTAYANNIVLFEPQSGSWSPLGTGMDSTVWALASTPSGIYAGGMFTSAGGVPCAHLARWNGFSWNPVGGGLDGPVQAITVAPNGDLVVGGTFTHAGGVAANNLARWNGTTWSSIGGGAGPWVQALTFAPNGDLVVGGQLGSAGSTVVGNIARWDGSAWSTFGAGTNGPVAALAFAPNGDLYAGGAFTTAGSSIARALARWDGTSWQPLGLPAPSWLQQQEVRGLAMDANGDLVATGSMELGANNLTAALRVSAGIPSVVPGASGDGRAVHAVPGVGFVLGAGPYGVGKAGATLQPLGQGIDGAIEIALRASTGARYLGGSFRSFEGVPAERIVRLDGTTATPLGTGLDGTCHALLERANGHLVAGGEFAFTGGLTLAVNHLAEWDGSAWSALGGGVNGTVDALLELANGDLVVGGQFLQTGQGQLTGYVARFDGSTWAPMGFGLNSAPRALCRMPNGDLIAAGGTGQAGYVARWNGSAWLPLGGATDGVVNSLTLLADGRLVAAGAFTNVGGVFVDHCAAWDGVTWQSLGFGPGGVVDAVIELPNGTLCALGEFSPQGVAFQPPGAMVWITNPITPVLFGGSPHTAVCDPDGALLVGGTFSGSTNGSAFLLRATPGCAGAVAVEGSGCLGAAGLVELAPDNLPWLGTTYRSTGTGVPPGALVLLVRSTATAAVSLPTVFPQAGAGCDLLVAPEQIDLLLPTGSEVQTALAIPNTYWFLGVAVHEQIVPFTFGPVGLTAVQSSNALRLTLGTL